MPISAQQKPNVVLILADNVDTATLVPTVKSQNICERELAICE